MIGSGENMTLVALATQYGMADHPPWSSNRLMRRATIE
jgi:hypothetical protein